MPYDVVLFKHFPLTFTLNVIIVWIEIFCENIGFNLKPPINHKLKGVNN